MELADVPRHRPLVFDKMESLIKEMQDPETGVPVKSQKLFLSFIPSAFTGFDVVEWLLERFSLDDTTNVEAVHIGTQLCQHGYFFPVNDLKNLTLKDDSSLYRFQSPYYWPWQPPRLSGSGSTALTLAPDNVEYAIYLVKRTLRNKQRHGLEEYEQEALATLKKNLAAKWEFITMQAEEQVRIAKDRKKGDKIVSDSQERAYWRVARPPPGVPHALESCPVPVRCRQVKPKKRSIEQLKREIQHLKASLDRTRVKTSIALEALMAYSETFAPYDPLLTPPQPSNPWVSDDTLFWQINSPFVEVPSEKRVQRWALSIEELVSDPTGLQEFTSFLRKEYSHENIRFWLAVMDLRRSSTTQIPTKLEEIYDEFLKPGAPCEINIDGATAERVAEGMRSGSRYAFDHAAEHVYGLLLKKDCYPRFIRSDHFQRLLTEGRNVHQKKAKFFNFGGQVKKKPGSTSGSGGSSSASGTGLARRRGSDRSLSGSAHELAVCAAQPPRPADPPSHSHSQSNLTEIPFRDPLEDDVAEVLPWECSSREGAYCARRRQDSAADSGSSSSDVSAAVAIADRTRRLPQQSTLDGGLRGAPPPLRRLSAIEPRHLAPLASPPHSPRLSRPAPLVQPSVHVPPHPTPTISVSSAPDDESTETPTGNISPEEPRSMAHSEEPSSVFASADATPTDPARPLKLSEVTVLQIESNSDDSTGTALAFELPDRKANVTVTSASLDDSCDDSIGSGKPSDRRESDPTRSSEDDIISQEASAAKDTRQSRAQRMDSSEVSMSVERKDDGTETILVTDRTSVSDSEVIRCSVLVNIPMVVDESEEFDCNVHAECLASMSVGETSIRSPVAPLAVGEDIGVDDDNLDKVPATPPMKVSDTRAASESDAIKAVAHRDELTSVSESDIVKRDNKSSSICERKQRNDICPWEDENSCESDAPFVKTYATLGYL